MSLSSSRQRAANILHKIIEEIAKEEGISYKKVNTILHSLFEQIAGDIRSGSLKGTHVLYLGKFIVKPYNINKYLNQLEDGTHTKNKRQRLSRA